MLSDKNARSVHMPPTVPDCLKKDYKNVYKTNFRKINYIPCFGISDTGNLVKSATNTIQFYFNIFFFYIENK